MAKENIQLVDRPYGYIRVPLSRKIKFKKISFKNISSYWNTFRLNNLKTKVANKREKLTEMSFSTEQLNSIKARERIEMKIMRKTKALAKLESKITFLETGSYFGEDYINSRAIKLKTLMMKNLEWNRANLYGVNEEAAKIILSGEQIHDKSNYDSKEKDLEHTKVEFVPPRDNQKLADGSVEKVIDEESAKIGAKVREILEETKSKGKKENHSESSNSAEENSQLVATEEIGQIIKKEIDKIDVTPTISSDKVAEAIEREMAKLNVKTDSLPQQVNKYINEDGTYRMTKDDIDESFRITRFNRNTTAENEDTNKEKINISPFDVAMKRKTPDVEVPKKAITAINDMKKLHISEITPPSIKMTKKEEIVEESTMNRAMPMVAQPRKDNCSPREDKKESAVPTEMARNLDALMTRVSVLKSEKKTIDSKAEDAERKAQNAEQSYIETVRMLSEYADTLERDCNESYRAMDEANKRAAATEAQIDAMLSMMENTSSVEPETTKGRIK